MKDKKNETNEFKLPTYEGYEVFTRSVKPPKKIDKKFKRKLKESGVIDFSEVLNLGDEKNDEN